MNLAEYLSELLELHDEVSVPGLGYFVRVRINAYYNDKEAKFYPPYHQAKFVPQPKDDNTFARYIADKKNISLASSKYFTEKFVIKIKEDASKGKYLFADLGLFYTDQDQLVFKPNNKIATDQTFYGYPQINIDRLGQPLSPGDVKPAFAGAISKPVVAERPVQTVEQLEYIEEEPEIRRHTNIWLIIFLSLTIIALSLFAVYQFYPSAFYRLTATFDKIIGKKEDTTRVYKEDTKADNAKKTIARLDTPAKTNATLNAAIDTLNVVHYEVIAVHFKKWQKAKADAEVERYKSIGVDAKISADAPGPLLKISVGTYLTLDKADSARLALINSRKISKFLAKTLPINPKK